MYSSISDNGNTSSVTTAPSKYKDKNIGCSTYSRERRAKSQYYGMLICVVFTCVHEYKGLLVIHLSCQKVFYCMTDIKYVCVSITGSICIRIIAH